MKYTLQLRDDNTKIHTVCVTLPGAQNDEAAIKAGLAHLKDLGAPFSKFDPATDLMEITVASIAAAPVPAPVAKPRRTLTQPASE
jgi:hypothetical protein